MITSVFNESARNWVIESHSNFASSFSTRMILDSDSVLIRDFCAKLTAIEEVAFAAGMNDLAQYAANLVDFWKIVVQRAQEFEILWADYDVCTLPKSVTSECMRYIAANKEKFLDEATFCVSENPRLLFSLLGDEIFRWTKMLSLTEYASKFRHELNARARPHLQSAFDIKRIAVFDANVDNIRESDFSWEFRLEQSDAAAFRARHQVFESHLTEGNTICLFELLDSNGIGTPGTLLTRGS